MSRHRLIAVVAASLLLLAGVTAALAGPPVNSGTVTLTLETPSGQGRLASNLADAFAARVKTLSDGKLVVKVIYGDPAKVGRGDRVWPWLAQHLNNVRTNKVQLATVWGASLELAGVKTVRALYAPFQLTSKTAATRATSGSIASQILQGFQGTGLTGLSLTPQGFSRIYAGKKPLRRLSRSS